MPLLTVVLLAVGGSADAFAVALGRGLSLRKRVVRDGLILALAFGVAQALMPLVGWSLGNAFATYITPIDPWLAFVLLSAVGARMLWQARSPHPEPGQDPDRLTVREVVLLALASSADGLAVGLSLTAWQVSIWPVIAALGVVTFAVTFLAVLLGQRIGIRFRRPAEVLGGLVLIGLGISILVEHLAA